MSEPSAVEAALRSEPRKASRLPSRLRTLGAAIGCWALLAASSTVSSALGSIGEGKAHAWWRAIAWNVPAYSLWVALTPWIAWVARASARWDWRRQLGVLATAAAVTSAIQTSLLLLAYATLRSGDPDGGVALRVLWREDFVYTFHLGLLTYAGVTVVLRGLDSRRRLRDERTRAAALEAQLTGAQLRALRSQLQPHFLFNTLNAISALTGADPALARSMLARLGDFLRLTLEDRDARTVPLERELECLQSYLAIQQIRFQDRLAMRLDLAENTRRAAVPQLLLQPLVENALQHGLLPKPGRGTLTISSMREGELLRLVIEDDGLGLPAGGPREGLGLRNTRERLEALAGAGATLSVTARAQGGARAEIALPFREQLP